MNAMFDTVVRHDAAFDVLEFTIGRTNDEPSFVSMRVTAPAADVLSELLAELVGLGCRVARAEDAHPVPADRDGCAPDDFYSTTNHQTFIQRNGQWITVERQRMDAAIVVESGRALCRKLRDIRQGDAIVCGIHGIKIVPEFQARDRLGFAFMTNEISSERRVETGVARIAAMMRDARHAGDRIAVVAGPVIVHTGGGSYFCDLIRRGYVDVLLAGNALAVHDVEQALFGTSLGVDLAKGSGVPHGHEHHIRAINTIRAAGSIAAAVESGVLTGGVMHAMVRADKPFVLVGSVRDDGPLPDVYTDVIEGQRAMRAQLQDVGFAIMVATMLHSIATGNILPASIPLVSVDINPATVTKLADRGSAQAMGIITDIGLFLEQLARELC
jgi:lysine-ketoglutarate reductase/saccharopine dehydrogenase-like protein (TIGR00300 family)